MIFVSTHVFLEISQILLFFKDEEKLKFFDEAVKCQTDIMVANILGQGIDIHLLGLREQAKEMGLQVELFSDDSYTIANHFALSTSQVNLQRLIAKRNSVH